MGMAKTYARTHAAFMHTRTRMHARTHARTHIQLRANTLTHQAFMAT